MSRPIFKIFQVRYIEKPHVKMVFLFHSRVFMHVVMLSAANFLILGLHLAFKRSQQNSVIGPAIHYNNQPSNKGMCGVVSVCILAIVVAFLSYFQLFYTIDSSKVLNGLIRYLVPYFLMTLVIPMSICVQRKEIIVNMLNVFTK